MKTMGLDNELHPGITMHKIPVKAGFPGLVFTIGMLAVFLLGVPELIYFQALAILLGLAVALMLRFIPREAGFITLVVTGVLLVCLVYVPSRDAWREEQKIDASLVQIAPPPPPAKLSFYPCDCRQYKLRQPCDSNPRAAMKAKKRHSRNH